MNGSAPVYLARGLGEPKVIFKLEEGLRSRASAGDGLVLCAGQEAPRFLANNVAMPVQDVWYSDSASSGLLVDHMLDRLNAARRLISENTQARVVRGGPHTGSLIMPRKEALPLSSPVQLQFFDKLAKAYNSGAPEVHPPRRTVACVECAESAGPAGTLSNDVTLNRSTFSVPTSH